MGSSMVGSMLQLPAVGGGSQLATISMLSAGFGIEHELAVSCGILLWAVTFMSVIPAGLAIARHEHVSIRAVAASRRESRRAGGMKRNASENPNEIRQTPCSPCLRGEPDFPCYNRSRLSRSLTP